ncbi:rod shape-determining protein RodA [Cerasicoccus arenae]|uniref:Rod shape-determining protein RodA n=2 Tax=Cerasicoccus arenae TaxID=424488 RepID=A0A8J3DCV6_9BACT|nr:FtsW/RodA/SpoVE family cell cycle protein [Cerasicoccus arenae]MBK1858832.1 rod shape-determining protein RodA [Cerasicoccus arenae]GHC04334.1 rod shape-determining protein RodA [Cerasicoccus arenae]
MQFGEEHRSDWISPLCMAILGVMGVFFIYSAQKYLGGGAWKMQIVWLVIGGFTYTVVSLVNYKFYLENAHIFYWFCVALLVPLALQALIHPILAAKGMNFSIPLVETRWGSTRWLDFGPISIQPAEIAKIGTLMMVASLLARSEVGTFRDSIKVLIKVGIASSIPVFLIFLQPDLGSSLVFPPMVFSLLYVSKLSEKFFATVFGLFLLAVLWVSMDVYRYQDFMRDNGYEPLRDAGRYEQHSLLPLKDYQRNRILAFAAPSVVDPRGTGVAWNLNQSLYAVAGGGLTGKGLGEGTQAKLGYLPPTVATNDFIFAVLAEESGYVGGLIVITLFFILVANGIRIAGMARDRFGALLAVGVSVILMIHVFINIGMTIGLMPITGLPLPFLSYGGSFVLSCCILQGLIQSVYRYRRDFS